MADQAIPVVEITGVDARERGRQYGEAARHQIERGIEFYGEAFARSAGLQWSEVLERSVGWIPMIEAYLPEILEEVRGIAEGANRRFEEILALNARGELSTQNPFAGRDKADEGCSSFALLPEATGDGHTYCGQNWDWRAGIADTVMVLRIVQPGKPTVIAQVEAGQVGRHGVNSAGLALNANGLGGARFKAGLGMPGTFVRRKILESWTLYDALQAVFRVTQRFSTNLLLTHRDGFAIDVETTPGRHGWMYPEDGVLVHTNHFVAFTPPQIDGSYKPADVDSLYRRPRIQKGLRGIREAGSPKMVHKVVRATMSDHFSHPHSVCCHPDPLENALDRYLTVISSLVDLTTGEYRLTHGAPCENEYELLPWNVYDGPSEPVGGRG